MSKKKFAILIQARTDSRRFPNKILKKINGKEVLKIMLMRLNKKFKKKIIVVIANKNYKKVKNICKNQKVKFFIGSNKDVLNRYYQCSKKNKLDTIVRIPSDCPLVDPNIITKGMKKFFSNKADYTSNLMPATYIDGNDVEIFSFKSLEKIYNKAKSKFDKEHVTTYLRRNKGKFKISNFKAGEDLSLKYRLTLDYKEDLIVIKKILNKNNIFLNYSSIKKIFEKKPEIAAINKKFIGTMWYQKNL